MAGNKVDKALEARRKRITSEEKNWEEKKKAHDSKLQTALEARNKRIQSSLPDIFSELQNSLTAEYDFYKNTKPTFGMYDDTYNSQRERRINISNLRSNVNAYSSYMDKGIADSILASLDQMEKGYDAYLSMAQFDTEDDYNAAVKWQKNWYDNWGHYADEADFAEYASQGAAIKNPTFNDAQGWSIGPWRFGEEDVGNIVTFSRDNYNDLAAYSEGGKYSAVGNLLYKNMTDDEVNIYNYLLAKEGKEAADSYLSDLDDTLRNREGKRLADAVTNIDIPVLEDGAGAGVENWASGVKQFFTNEEQPTPISQYANAYIGESLDGFGAYAHQAATTIGNMAPSILLSYATGLPVVGDIAMGVSAAGNAYKYALSEGYDKLSARAYSTLVGAAEGYLQYAIGGITKLGGMPGKLAGKIAKIDNSLLRVSAKLGTSLLSEITEEELQNFLEPAFRTLIFGEEYDAPTFDELLETAIVTAISTGTLEGGGTVATNIATKSKYGASQNELVSEALEIDPNNAFAQKMQGRLDNGKNLSGEQLSHLVEQNEAAMTTQDMANIQSAAESRLTELGETGDVSAIAAALTKQAAGEKLSKAEKQAISNSKYGQRVANELNTKNIKSGEYSSAWAENIGTNRINADEYSRLVEAAQLPQETAEVTGDQVAAEAPKAAQVAQPDTMEAPKATVQESQTVVNQPETAAANDQQMTSKLTGKESLQVTEESSAAEEPKTKTVTLEKLSDKYGAQAQAMIHTYTAGQDVAKYDQGYQAAYDMGKSGVSFDYVKHSQSASYLTDTQKQLAYEAGKAASDTAAKELDAKNKAAANGKKGWKKGAVKGDGVTISEKDLQ